MKMYKIMLLASVVITSSCTLGPDYKRPQFYSDDKIASNLNISNQKYFINKEWYLQFNDPFLNTLISRGLINSPNVGAAIAKLRQSRQNLKINNVENLPTINANGSYYYNKESANSGASLSSDYYQLGFDAAWELDIWGGGRRLSEQARALLAGASSNLDNVRLSLTSEIAVDYFLLRQYQEQLQIAYKNIKVQEDIFDIVKQKQSIGLADDLSLQQSKYILETTRSQIPQLETEIEKYKNALSVLIGELPRDIGELLDKPTTNIITRPFDFDLNNLYNISITSIRNRPDVKMAEANLIAQNAVIGQAVATMFPSVSIQGFFGLRSLKANNLFSSDSDMLTYSPAISFPILDWGKLYNNVLLQEYRKSELIEVYKESILTAISDIKTASVALSKEYEKNKSTAKAKQSQETVAQLTLDKYRQGLIPFNDVLSSQQNLLAAQNSYISSNAAIYTNIVGFYKAIGGGYSTPIDEIR